MPVPGAVNELMGPAVLRPTHFLALPLQYPPLHNAMAACQAACSAADPALKRCEVPPEKAHFTYFVFHAGTAEQESAAVAALAACAPLAAAAFPTSPPRVALSGLGAFGDRVLYAKATPSPGVEQLRQLRAEVADEFVRRGVLGEDAHGAAAWVPHVTLLKQSAAFRSERTAPRAAGVARRAAVERPPRIRPAAYAGLEGAEMGTYTIR